MESSDWISVVALAVTVLGLLGVFRRLSKKMDANTAKTDNIETRFFRLIAENMEALAASRPPEKTRALDIQFDDGTRYVVLLLLGEWITIATGVRMQGMYERNNSTTYLIVVDNVWRLRGHSHAEREIVEVVSGVMENLITGEQYKAGQSWTIPANESHTVSFESSSSEPCMVKVTTIPSLKQLSEVPLLLDNLAGLHGSI